MRLPWTLIKKDTLFENDQKVSSVTFDLFYAVKSMLSKLENL